MRRRSALSIRIPICGFASSTRCRSLVGQLPFSRPFSRKLPARWRRISRICKRSALRLVKSPGSGGNWVDATIRVNLSRYVGTTQINLVGQDKWKGYRLWRAEDIARRTRAQNCGVGQGGQRRHGASNITHRRKDPRSLLERVSDATIRTEM